MAYSPNQVAVGQGEIARRGVMSQVYAWMTAGLLVTGAIALFTSRSEALLRIIYGTPFVLFGRRCRGFCSASSASVELRHSIAAGAAELIGPIVGYMGRRRITPPGRQAGTRNKVGFAPPAYSYNRILRRRACFAFCPGVSYSAFTAVQISAYSAGSPLRSIYSSRSRSSGVGKNSNSLTAGSISGSAALLGVR